MNLRTLSILVALALLGVFALLNWSAFSAPTALSLGFTRVQAPLGLIMLAVTALVSGLFATHILFQQAAVILDARRTSKELKAHRELADKAEASRFTELQTLLVAELRKMEAQHAADATDTKARVEQLEQRLQDAFSESAAAPCRRMWLRWTTSSIACCHRHQRRRRRHTDPGLRLPDREESAVWA